MATESPDYRQASAAPTTKVISGGIAGAISAILVWVANAFELLPRGTQIPGEIASAITTVISFIVSYLVPPSGNDKIIPQTTQSSTQVAEH